MKPLDALMNQPPREMPNRLDVIGTAEYFLKRGPTETDDGLTVDGAMIAAAIFQQSLTDERYRDGLDEQLAGFGELLIALQDSHSGDLLDVLKSIADSVHNPDVPI